MKYFVRIISLFTLIFTIISMPVSAFALDDSCITKHGYFNSCKNTIPIDEDGLNANAKYIADSDEGCFYFNMRFTDSIMSAGDQIHFKFIISNELDSISFDIDENGTASYTSQSTVDKLSIISKFKIVPIEKSGSATIGFEIKDKAYRKLLNSISCTYYCGNKRFVKILDNAKLDMHKDAPITSRRNSKSEIRKTTSKRAGKTTTKPITKFVPKIITNKTTTQSTTKFSANGNQATTIAQSEATSDNATSQSDEEYWNNAMADVTTEKSSSPQISSQNRKTSALAKYMLVLGVIVAITGVIVIIIGISKKDKALSSEQNPSEDDSE